MATSTTVTLVRLQRDAREREDPQAGRCGTSPAARSSLARRAYQMQGAGGRSVLAGREPQRRARLLRSSPTAPRRPTGITSAAPASSTSPRSSRCAWATPSPTWWASSAASTSCSAKSTVERRPGPNIRIRQGRGIAYGHDQYGLRPRRAPGHLGVTLRRFLLTFWRDLRADR